MLYVSFFVVSWSYWEIYSLLLPSSLFDTDQTYCKKHASDGSKKQYQALKNRK
jgi:hypothetical protein